MTDVFRPLIVLVTTVPVTVLTFYRGFIPFLKDKGFEVRAVSSNGPELEDVKQRDSITVHAVQMKRAISPRADLEALVGLYRVFLKMRPSIVHASTPKAGLLGMLAATLAGVPAKLYTVRGLSIEMRTGLIGRILAVMESLTCWLAHRVVANSRSVERILAQKGLCDPEKLCVPGKGSSNGVDATGWFDPRRVDPESVARLRSGYGIPTSATVLGYVGRIVRDKGMVELAGAWLEIRKCFPETFLMVVGSPEAEYPLPPGLMELLTSDHRVIMISWIPNKSMPEHYLLMDVLVLPTYREGFPNVVLEASAMERPVVATRVTGCVDAVLHGITGTLVPPRNTQALISAITRYLLDGEMRRRHGRNGRVRALKHFRAEKIWAENYRVYCQLLMERGVPAPGH